MATSTPPPFEPSPPRPIRAVAADLGLAESEWLPYGHTKAKVHLSALEQKVQAAGEGRDAGLVTTQDLLQQLDGYRRIREVVEKTRYGQYL